MSGGAGPRVGPRVPHLSDWGIQLQVGNPTRKGAPNDRTQHRARLVVGGLVTLTGVVNNPQAEVLSTVLSRGCQAAEVPFTYLRTSGAAAQASRPPKDKGRSER